VAIGVSCWVMKKMKAWYECFNACQTFDDVLNSAADDLSPQQRRQLQVSQERWAWL